MTEVVKLSPDPCSVCGSRGKVQHDFYDGRSAKIRYAYVECAGISCRVTGPKVQFRDHNSDEGEEFTAIARWNQLHYKR